MSQILNKDILYKKKLVKIVKNYSLKFLYFCKIYVRFKCMINVAHYLILRNGALPWP